MIRERLALMIFASIMSLAIIGCGGSPEGADDNEDMDVHKDPDNVEMNTRASDDNDEKYESFYNDNDSDESQPGLNTPFDIDEDQREIIKEDFIGKTDVSSHLFENDTDEKMTDLFG